MNIETPMVRFSISLDPFTLRSKKVSQNNVHICYEVKDEREVGTPASGGDQLIRKENTEASIPG